MLTLISGVVHTLLLIFVAYRVIKFGANKYLKENLGLILINCLLIFNTDISRSLLIATLCINILLFLVLIFLFTSKKS